MTLSSGPMLCLGRAWAQTQPSLSLPAAMELALKASPATSTAQLQIVQAQQRLAQAQAQQRWQVTFSSSAGLSNAAIIQGPPSQQTFHEVVNSLSVPLTIGRKGKYAVAQANAQVTVAQAQLESARLALAAQVSSAYFDLLRKRALLKIAQETEANAVRQLTEAEKRFRAGDVPELDVLRAKSPVASAESGVLQAENAVLVAEQTWNGLLGRNLETAADVSDITTPLPETLPMTLEEARAQAIKNNPEVRAANAAVLAAERAVDQSRTGRDPLYALQASDTRSNDQTGFSRLDSVQATVTIPLTDGGLLRAQVKEATAALEATKAQVRTATLAAEVAVSAAYRTAQSTRKLLESARLSQELAQTAYDKALRGYQAGLFPLTDILSAQSALTQAKIAYTQAIYDAAASLATLDNALGVLPK